MATDAEFDAHQVTNWHKQEADLLAAEAVVMEQANESIRWDLHCQQNPRCPDARLHAQNRRQSLGEPRGYTDHHDPKWRAFLVELACYGWRRDYGEWPTVTNLADRVANDCGITHRTARQRIGRMLNDNTDASALYAIRADRLDDVLSGNNAIGPWDGSLAEMRFYVFATAMERQPLYASFYRDRCWRLEGAA